MPKTMKATILSIALAHALGPEDHAEGLQQDQDIEEGGVILGVIEIVFELVA